MNIDPATLGWIGIAVAFVGSFILLSGIPVNSAFRLRTGRSAKSDRKSDSRMGVYLVVAAFMVLLAQCSSAVLDGKVWYRGLIAVSWANSGLTISNSHSFKAYLVIALGLFLWWLPRKRREDDDPDRRAAAHRWTCRFCGAANEPGLAVCQKCNFPADATSEELALARAASSPAAVYQARGKRARGRVEWGKRSFWDQVLSAIVMVLWIVGLTLAMLTAHVLLGLGIIAGVSVIVWVAYKARGRPI